MNDAKRALVLVMSEARNDPRVRRQLTWLAGDGWTTDTVGIGPRPSDEVAEHFPIGPQRRWVGTRWGTAISYRLLGRRAMFRRLVSDRIPGTALERIAAGGYQLILFNDFDFLPLVHDPNVFTPRAQNTHLHADIHEYREPRRRFTFWNWVTRRLRDYQRTTLGAVSFDSRSTVATHIAELYAREFGIEPPAIIRNAPPYHDLRPGDIDPTAVRMLFHGLASRQRGFDEIFEALRSLDERYTMTFMLTGNPGIVEQVRRRAESFGDRVRVVPPVPMTELPATINRYDLEIIFYPPIQTNVEYSLPNKFFEAIQGRLGVIVGESPMMAELVRRYDVGVVVAGWSGRDLAAALNALTPDRLRELKSNADAAARELNAETEGRALLKAIRQRPEAAPPR